MINVANEVDLMKFNNIERNILYWLGNEWLKSRTLGPFDIRWVFDKFSDIPDKNIKIALRSLSRSGFVKLAPNYANISLTQKGLSKIKVINLPENGEFPVPKDL
jgi:hypothetical protein